MSPLLSAWRYAAPRQPISSSLDVTITERLKVCCTAAAYIIVTRCHHYWAPEGMLHRMNGKQIGRLLFAARWHQCWGPEVFVVQCLVSYILRRSPGPLPFFPARLGDDYTLFESNQLTLRTFWIGLLMPQPAFPRKRINSTHDLIFQDSIHLRRERKYVILIRLMIQLLFSRSLWIDFTLFVYK